MNKNAAMFGLDARLSLAIFTVLSLVILFVSLGMRQEIKTVALITDIEEIGKAVTQYYMDTGVYPESIAQDSEENKYTLKSSVLLNDSKVGWRGPYIKYENSKVGGDFLISQKYGNISLLKLNSKDKWLDLSDINKVKCTPLEHCRLWLGLQGMKREDILRLDSKIDGFQSADDGIVRYNLSTGEVFYGLGSTIERANPSLIGTWILGNWGVCSAACGEGVKTRSVSCSKDYCDEGSKPSDSQSCNLGSCTWIVGDWGSCSAKCDGGTQNRSVTCPTAGCDPAARPSSSQSCNTHSCPLPTYSCSSGTLSGTVCNINECKYSEGAPIYWSWINLNTGATGFTWAGTNVSQGSTYSFGAVRKDYSYMNFPRYHEICKTSSTPAVASCPVGYILSGGKCI